MCRKIYCGWFEPFRSGWSRATFRLEQGSQWKQFAKLGTVSFCRSLEASYWRLWRLQYITCHIPVYSAKLPVSRLSKPPKPSKIQACGSTSTNNQNIASAKTPEGFLHLRRRWWICWIKPQLLEPMSRDWPLVTWNVNLESPPQRLNLDIKRTWKSFGNMQMHAPSYRQVQCILCNSATSCDPCGICEARALHGGDRMVYGLRYVQCTVCGFACYSSTLMLRLRACILWICTGFHAHGEVQDTSQTQNISSSMITMNDSIYTNIIWDSGI